MWPLRQTNFETTRIKAQCAAIKQSALKLSAPLAKLVKRMARRSSGGGTGRNADIAAIWRSEGEPAVLRDWIGTWTQAVAGRPAATAPLGLWPEEARAGSANAAAMPTQSVLHRARGGAAEAYRKLRDLTTNTSTNSLGLGTPDAATLIDMAAAPKGGQDGDVMLPIGSGKRLREGFFGPRAWEAARLACNSVRCARPNGTCDTGFWQRCDDGWDC